MELKLELIKNVDIFELDAICKLDKNWKEFCQSNKKFIKKLYLTKHNVSYTDSDVDIFFRLLYKQLKIDRFYKDDFPLIVLKSQGKKELLRVHLNREPTKYELMVLRDASNMNIVSIKDIKHLIKMHVYRFGNSALGNPRV